MPEEFECEKCGRTFDSQRGLSLHETQSHGDEEQETGEEEKDSDQEDKELNINVTLDTRHAMVGVFVLGILIGFGAGYVSPGNFNITDSSQSVASGVVELETTSSPYGDINYGTGSGTVETANGSINVDGEPYIGNENAKLNIVAYEDFECPFCNKYNNGAFPKIMSDYIKNGNAKYYLKNFPLQRIHPWATKAGVASECAMNQDAEAFWTFKKGFFDNQEALKGAHEKDEKLFDKSMKRWAEQTGLDTEKFNNCYDNQKTVDEVKQDQKEGVKDGVSGTPTIFVGNQKLVGAQPYSRFKSAIESQLN